MIANFSPLIDNGIVVEEKLWNNIDTRECITDINTSYTVSIEQPHSQNIRWQMATQSSVRGMGMRGSERVDIDRLLWNYFRSSGNMRVYQTHKVNQNIDKCR